MEDVMLTYEEWAERYEPIANECGWCKEYILFEPSEPEDLKFLQDNMIGDGLNIWTIVDDGEGNLIIDSGWRFVNRLAYVITKWPRVSQSVLVQAEYDYQHF